MHFVNCGQDFTYEGEIGRIHAALMPDGVNLNAAGMEQLASCLDPIIHVSDLFFLHLSCRTKHEWPCLRCIYMIS